MAANTRKPSATAQKARAAGASVPADRQTAQHDVDPEAFPFNFRGEEYIVDVDMLDDVEFIETFSSNLVNGIRMLIGVEGTNRLKTQLKSEDPKGRARIGDFQFFFEQLSKDSAFLRD